MSASKINPQIWLFTGPEEGEKRDAIKALQVELEKSQASVDVHKKYASDTPVSEIVSFLETGSLFSSAKFVILQQAELIKKKEDIELLFSWCKLSSTGADASRLVLISQEISVDKKLENIIPKDNKKVFWEMFESRKEQWIRSFFQKRGFSITQDAIATLLELVENNTHALGNECEKLCNFIQQGTQITEDLIDSTLEHNREESPFTMFDRMSEGDLEKSINVLEKLLQSKESSSVQIIAGLSHCFRRLQDWHSLFLNNYPNEFDLKKAGFSSKKIQEQYRRASRIWNQEQTMHCIALLSQADFDLRTLGTEQEENTMHLLLYALLCKKGRAIAKIEV